MSKYQDLTDLEEAKSGNELQQQKPSTTTRAAQVFKVAAVTTAVVGSVAYVVSKVVFDRENQIGVDVPLPANSTLGSNVTSNDSSAVALLGAQEKVVLATVAGMALDQVGQSAQKIIDGMKGFVSSNQKRYANPLATLDDGTSYGTPSPTPGAPASTPAPVSAPPAPTRNRTQSISTRTSSRSHSVSSTSLKSGSLTTTTSVNETKSLSAPSSMTASNGNETFSTTLEDTVTSSKTSSPSLPIIKEERSERNPLVGLVALAVLPLAAVGVWIGRKISGNHARVAPKPYVSEEPTVAGTIAEIVDNPKHFGATARTIAEMRRVDPESFNMFSTMSSTGAGGDSPNPVFRPDSVFGAQNLVNSTGNDVIETQGQGRE